MAARIYPPVGRTADDGASEDGGIQRHKALALDDKLLSASNDLVYGSDSDGPRREQPLLRLDPIWDPLRTDPAFQKLCEE